VSGFLLKRIVGFPSSPLGRLDRAQEDVPHSQRLLLQDLILRAKDTAWGRAHGYDEILRSDKLVSAYQERVPLSTAEDFKPYVARTKAGEESVLWPGRTRHFAVSSGTASRGRLIPVSEEMEHAMAQAGMIPGLQYVRSTGSASFLGGKILMLPGAVTPEPDQPDVLVGEVSALQARGAQPALVRRFQAVPQELAMVEDWEEKVERVAACVADQDVRAVIVVPSWAPLLFEAVLRHASCARRTRVASLREIWPRFQVFFGGGVAMSAYRGIIEHYAGSNIDFIESYSASEGVFAFQDDPASTELTVHLVSGVFYELVRVEDRHLDQPRRHTLADVELGVDYALYVSTCAGLWSYPLEDVLQFTSLDPPRLRVRGRTVSMLDRAGESVYASEVAEALRSASRHTGVPVRHHHVTYASASSEMPQHEWLLELTGSARDPAPLAEAVDAYLCEHNRRYGKRRGARAMASPIVTVLPGGTSLEYLRSRKGRLTSQSKLIPVSEARTVAEGLDKAATVAQQRSANSG
jgi:hypothetical protein